MGAYNPFYGISSGLKTYPHSSELVSMDILFDAFLPHILVCHCFNMKQACDFLKLLELVMSLKILIVVTYENFTKDFDLPFHSV